jgi:hypothetical protein
LGAFKKRRKNMKKIAYNQPKQKRLKENKYKVATQSRLC